MRKLLIILLMGCLHEPVTAQVLEIPIKQKLTDATIVECKPPYQKLGVLMAKTNRYYILEMTDKTVYQRERKATASLSELKPGMRVELTYDLYQTSNRLVIKTIEPDANYYGNVSFEGIYESLKEDLAYIDGQAVKLMDKKELRGMGGWKDLKFDSFQKMQLRSLVKLEGKRDINGYILIKSGTVTPMLTDDFTLNLRRAVSRVVKVSKTDIILGVQKFPLIDHIPIQDYVNRIGMSLVPEYIKRLPLDHPDKIDFKFFIVKDNEANVYSLPDGTTVIHTELLKTIENDAQLATILGHEISHVIYGHQAAKIKQIDEWMKSLGPAVATVVLAKDGNIETANATASLINGVLNMTKQSFSRKKENQADRVGLYYMTNAGFDPREGVKFWRKMINLAQDKEFQYSSTSDLTSSYVSEKSEANPSSKLSDNPKSSGLLVGVTKLMIKNDKAQKEKKDTTKTQQKPSISDYAALWDAEISKLDSISTYNQSHPSTKNRFDNMNFLLATTYSGMDSTKTNKMNIGRETYKTEVLDVLKDLKKNIVEQPKPEPALVQEKPSKPAIQPPKKSTPKTPQKKKGA